MKLTFNINNYNAPLLRGWAATRRGADFKARSAEICASRETPEAGTAKFRQSARERRS